MTTYKPYRYKNKKSVFYYLGDKLVAKKNKRNGKVYWLSPFEHDRELISLYFNEIRYTTKEKVLKTRASDKIKDMGFIPNKKMVKCFTNNQRKIDQLRSDIAIRKYLFGTKSYKTARLISTIECNPKSAKIFAEKFGYSLLIKVIELPAFYNEMLINMLSLNSNWIKRIINLSYKDKNESNCYVVQDTVRLLRMMNEKIDLNSLPRFQSIRQIHDYISREYSKLQHELVTYTYEDKIIDKYHKTIGDVYFRLPKDNHELIDVGISMGNCVGSYGNIHNNNTTIVIGYQGDKPVLCLEIAGKECRQCEGNHSRTPSDEMMDIAIKYLKEINIEKAMDRWW